MPGLHSLGTPVCLITTDERIVMANQAYLDLTDRRAQDVIGVHLGDLVSAPGYEVAKLYLDHAISQAVTVNFTRLWLSPAGDQKWISVSYVPVLGVDGKLIVIVAQMTQIQDVKSLDDAFIERERLLRHLTDDTGRPILYIDSGLLLRFMNRPFRNWIDNHDPGLVGKHVGRVLPRDTYELYLPFVQRCLMGEMQSVEALSMALVGSRRHVRMEFLPDVLDDGRIAGVYIVGNDIEDDYQLRQTLIRKELEIRSMMDSVDMPLSKSDRELRYLYVNQIACDWFGREESQIIGKHWSEVIGEQQFSEIEVFAARALAGEAVTYQRYASYPARQPGQVRVNIFPDRTSDGDVCGVYVVITDIERDHQLKQQIIDRERQLRLITDNIGLPISYIDADRRVCFYNKTGEEWLGLKECDVLGKTVEDAFGTNVVAAVQPYIAAAMSGRSTTYERLADFPNKGVRWMRGHLVPDKRDDGTVVGIYTVLTDIHDDVIMRESLQQQERQLRLFTDNIPESVAYLDVDRRYKFVNNTFLTQRGKARHEVIGQTSEEVLGREAADLAAPFVKRALEGETVVYERLVATVGSGPRWHRVRTVPDMGPKGKVQGLYVVGTDIDELKRTELELRRANWMLTSHFENSPLAVIEWDREFQVRRWSPQAERIFGWPESEVLGKNYLDWRFIVEGDDQQFAAMGMRLTEMGHPRATNLNRNYRRDGQVIWCEWYNSSLRDESGEIVSILSLVQDVTTRVLAEERLVYQATHDDLTNLPNRAMLHDRMQQAISRARRSGTSVAALFIDLDRFKEVNDTLGHRIGDELLCEIAERLKRTLRDCDFLVRLSGDEFMVVLEHLPDLAPSRIVAAKILDEIRHPTNIEGHEIHVSASIGISVFPDDADDVEALLKNSDMAMYRAKELGKNTFQFFSGDLAAQGTAMRLLETSLRSALVKNEFELYYQPKIEMQSGRILGAEALLRWHHPTRGLVMPSEFVQLAEDAGLMPEIGNWVLDIAFAQVRRWQDQGYKEMRLAINLSAGQFRATNLLDRVKTLLAREQCRPDCIEIEITETSMLRDPDGVGRNLKALRELGLRVAIDDFGTGYSSLSHLKRFPIDTLKIDKTFVANILLDREDAAIVSGVIAIASAMDLEVIAEGVETEAQRELLAARGCDAFQGYLFSPALPIVEFDAMLERNYYANGPLGSSI
ncbi:MAG: PAS domain-containing protein [Burkholderiales bacterium]|nr:PAS domain-containing protein [Burkholderiales bacterium]